MLTEIRTPVLPEGIKTYDIAGQYLFPLFAESGNLTSSVCAFLIKQGAESHPQIFDGGELSLPSDGKWEIRNLGGGWMLGALQFGCFDDSAAIIEEHAKLMV